jgi:hypothetical protein
MQPEKPSFYELFAAALELQAVKYHHFCNLILQKWVIQG